MCEGMYAGDIQYVEGVLQDVAGVDRVCIGGSV